jgi:anti-sigma factor RsiW
MSEGRIGGMTCREAASLLPRFFDGELDPRHMRSVALHSTRCQACEAELRQLERCQQVLIDTVNTAVDSIDFAAFWTGVEARLVAPQLNAWQRLRTWWAEGEHRWVIRLPAYAAATAGAVLALLYAMSAWQPSPRPGGPQVADLTHSAIIDELLSDSDSVTMYSDPDTSTTVLWVTDEMPGGEE